MAERNVYLSQVSPEQAWDLLARALAAAGWPLGARGAPGGTPELAGVTQSLGRICAARVTARLSSPHYHAAAMDGVAVHAAETFEASEARPVPLKLGQQAIPVDTGDPLPDGYDAVIMTEDLVRREADAVTIIAPAVPWQHVRTLGEDVVASEVIVPRGRTITPWDIGAMMAAGVDRVPVARKPRVMVIPTGDEVVPAGTVPARGAIIDSNSHMICALVAQWGGEALAHPVVPDRLDAIRDAIATACRAGPRGDADPGADAGADVVCTIAGTSAGREDYTAAAVSGLGRVLVHGLAMKPGKPTLIGLVEGKPVLGLPGYPVSCALACELFLKPLIALALGTVHAPAPVVTAALSAKCPSSPGVDEFLRVRVGRIRGRYVAAPLARGAGSTTSLVRADALVRLPPGCQGVEQGELVEARLVRPLEEIERSLLVVGSHDLALDVLADHFAARMAGSTLSSAHVGSLAGLIALRSGYAHMTGTHLIHPETGEYNIPYVRQTFRGTPVTLVNLTWRTQGLMVAPGNPRGIAGLRDLARGDVKIVNRQRGAGTRVLLDLELARLGIRPGDVTGYDREVYTHTAVAVAVATGVADAGLGIYPAAAALGLEFIPVARERYDMVVPDDLAHYPIVAAAIETIRTDGFKRAVAGLGGYDVSDTGNVMWQGGGP